MLALKYEAIFPTIIVTKNYLFSRKNQAAPFNLYMFKKKKEYGIPRNLSKFNLHIFLSLIQVAQVKPPPNMIHVSSPCLLNLH